MKNDIVSHSKTKKPHRETHCTSARLHVKWILHVITAEIYYSKNCVITVIWGGLMWFFMVMIAEYVVNNQKTNMIYRE